MNNQVVINKENIMNKELKISAENALAAYNNTDANGRELLEHLFGEDIFKLKDIRDRIKTFNDAFYELGDKHELVRAYNNLIVSNCMSKDIIAYAKLKIIAEALNEGWKPTFGEKEFRYYPSFYIYTKEEYDELNEIQKKELIVVRNSKIKLNENCGDIYALGFCTLSYSVFSNSYHLALRTWELSEYCGKQFIDIWAEFLFA